MFAISYYLWYNCCQQTTAKGAPPMLNLKYLPAIETILQEGSITAASKKLYVSQPALSQTIKQVEAELGSPIFRRGVTPIALTYEGELYIQAAQRMQDIDRSLHARVADARAEFGSSAGCCTGQKSVTSISCGTTTRPPGCWPVVRLTPTRPSASLFSSALVAFTPCSSRYFFT